MGGTQNSNVLLQQQLIRTTGQRTAVAPFNGIKDAVILDNDQTNSSLPAGTARVTIPSFSTTMVFGPTAYPGTIAPAPGSSVVVAFIPPKPNQVTANAIRILSLPGTGSSGDISEITSNDGTVTIVDPTGPTVDLSVPAITQITSTGDTVEITNPTGPVVNLEVSTTLAALVEAAGGPQISGGTIDGVIAGLVTLGLFSS